jgi:hypothetical protein
VFPAGHGHRSSGIAYARLAARPRASDDRLAPDAPHGTNVTVLTNNQGKVTGYRAAGITSGTPTTTSTFGNWSTCPAGEHFMGWLNGPENAFHNETTPGSSVLQVSNGLKTAELPVTPIV